MYKPTCVYLWRERCIYTHTHIHTYICTHLLLFVELQARNSSTVMTEQEFQDGEFLDMVIITYKADLMQKTLKYGIDPLNLFIGHFLKSKPETIVFSKEKQRYTNPLYTCQRLVQTLQPFSFTQGQKLVENRLNDLLVLLIQCFLIFLFPLLFAQIFTIFAR